MILRIVIKEHNSTRKTVCRVIEILPKNDIILHVVISITTIHNLNFEECKKSLQEIERISKKHKFITVDAYSNEKEKELMYAWNLTAKTILHTDKWKELFIEAGYTGDYYWFKP